MNRCFLFVPGDSERKLEKAAAVQVDALIIDLEDAVAADARPAARQLATEFLAGRSDTWVRINPLDSEDALADLEAVMPAAPTGIILPKPRSAADAVLLSAKLDALEQANNIQSGSTGIIALCTERASALFSLQDYRGATERLQGLSWGAEDLSAELGAAENRDETGNWLAPYEIARSLCLFAAAAAEVQAIDTVFTNFRDDDGLASYAANASRDGFTAMLAIHPDQVVTIQDAFTPAQAQIDYAQRVVELFAQNPGAGTLGLDGKMLDRPHLVQANRILSLARKKS